MPFPRLKMVQMIQIFNITCNYLIFIDMYIFEKKSKKNDPISPIKQHFLLIYGYFIAKKPQICQKCCFKEEIGGLFGLFSQKKAYINKIR